MKKLINFILIMICSNFLFANKAREGEALFEQKKYGEASQKFLQAEVDEPENFQHSYNRGVSDYKDGNFARAAEGFQKSSRSPDKVMQEKSLYNLGNALYKKGDMEESVKAFDKALQLNPKNSKILDNKKWVEEQIKKQKQQQQKNKDDKNDKNDQNKEDKKNSENNSKKDGEDQNKKQKKPDQEKKQQEKSQDKNKSQDEKKDSKDQGSKDQGKDQKEQKKKDSKASSNKEKEKPGKGSNNKADQKQREIKKEEVQRILRSLEGMDQVYGVPPKFKKSQERQDKDW